GTEADTFDLLDELVARIGTDPTAMTSRHGSYGETKRCLAGLSVRTDRARPVTACSVATRPRLQQVGVLPTTTPCRSDRGARRALRGSRCWGSVARARLHPGGRGVQPPARQRHSLPSSRCALLAQAHGCLRSRCIQRREGGRAVLADPLMGVRASMGNGRRLWRLPRAGSPEPADRLLRHEPRTSALREALL